MPTLTKKSHVNRPKRKSEKAVVHSTYSTARETDEFMKIQSCYLQKLKTIQSKQQDGQNIDKQKQQIINSLKNAGILDESGEIAKPYRKDED